MRRGRRHDAAGIPLEEPDADLVRKTGFGYGREELLSGSLLLCEILFQPGLQRMELRFGAGKGLLGLTMFADCGFQASLQGVGLILGLVRTSGGISHDVLTLHPMEENSEKKILLL